MPEIAFIMGKSSSGKDKLFKALSEDEELNLQKVIPYTTRPMRVGEKQGIEYNFVTDGQADEMLAAGRVIEMRTYNTVHGVWKYFTADDGQIELGRDRYIIIGTLEAYEKFLKYFGKEHLLPIYIETEDAVRLQRAMKREAKQAEPDYAEMCRRFLADCEDFSEENINKCEISRRFYNNGELEDCLNEIKEAIKADMG